MTKRRINKGSEVFLAAIIDLSFDRHPPAEQRIETRILSVA